MYIQTPSIQSVWDYKQNLHYLTFYTAMSRELMFRATPGIGVNVRNSWLGTTALPPADDTCFSMSTVACNTHYRNPKVDFWGTLPISEVSDL
jgi:hypothetical protein